MNNKELEVIVNSHKQQLIEIKDRLRVLEKQIDTLGSPWWKRVWFRIDGWPPWWIVGKQKKRFWHKY